MLVTVSLISWLDPPPPSPLSPPPLAPKDHLIPFFPSLSLLALTLIMTLHVLMAYCIMQVVAVICCDSPILHISLSSHKCLCARLKRPLGIVF